MKKFLPAIIMMVFIPSYAATVNYDGKSYDIVTVSGTSLDNIAVLESQFWWGDPDLAKEISHLFADALGTPHELTTAFGDQLSLGPMFEWDANIGYMWLEEISQPILFGYDVNQIWNYAVVSPSNVPVPAASLFFCTALVSILGIKHKN